MPSTINPKVPEAVERVLLKALAKDRPDRYPDVQSLVDAFKGAWQEAGVQMQGTAITMRPTSLKGATAVTGRAGLNTAGQGAVLPTQQKGRSAWPFIAGGILILFCLAIVFIALRGSNRLRSPDPATTIPVPVIPPARAAVRTPLTNAGTRTS